MRLIARTVSFEQTAGPEAAGLTSSTEMINDKRDLGRISGNGAEGAHEKKGVNLESDGTVRSR